MNPPSYLGYHITVDLYDCTIDLDNIEQLQNILHTTASKFQLNILKEIWNQFTPQGITGILLLAESHLAIHTWPEYKFAAVDLFTCNLQIHKDDLEVFLQEVFMTKKVKTSFNSRGIL